MPARKLGPIQTIIAGAVISAVIGSVISPDTVGRLFGIGGHADPTPTPVESVSPTGAIDPAALPVVFEDALDTPNSNWDVRESGACRARWSETGYEIEVRAVMTKERVPFCRQSPLAPVLEEVFAQRVEVQFEMVSADLSGEVGGLEVGVACRVEGFSETGSAYHADIAPDRYYEISRFENGASTRLLEGVAPRFPFEDPIQLRLDCIPHEGILELVFTVNGTTIARETDGTPLPSGSGGFTVTNLGHEPAIVRFQTFSIRGE